MAEKENREPCDDAGSRPEEPEGSHDPSHDGHNHDHHHDEGTTEVYRIRPDGSAERIEKK